MILVAMASSVSDRTVNKIALCGAIVAGVAYLGYSVASKVMAYSNNRKRHKDEKALLDFETCRRNRIYLRRLSGSRLSEAVVDAFLQSAGQDGRIQMLRPLTVQERIRELNLRARHFAETVLAVQLHSHYDQHVQRPSDARSYGLSLQHSPAYSPRPLSPIDIPNLGSSRCSSIENLSWTSSSPLSNGLATLGRRPSHRRTRNRSHDSFTKELLDESVDCASEKLLDDREAELRSRLMGFESGQIKLLTPYEARSLVALLHAKDCDTLERALVTIGNCAAFSQNQDFLREAGCLVRLQHLIVHSDLTVKLAAIRATANLSLNAANQEDMEHFVSLLLSHLNACSGRTEQLNDETLVMETLATLTNIAALTRWHTQYIAALPRLVELSLAKSSKLSLQALKLLINLSTNEDVVPSLIQCKSLQSLWTRLDISRPEDQLLRVVTLMSNVVCSASKLRQLDSFVFENGKLDRCDMLSRLSDIMSHHPHEDVRWKARLLHHTLEQRY